MFCRLIVFDLDGTLAESKSPMDSEMGALLKKLLEKKAVAVMSGGSYVQFQKQFLSSLSCKDRKLLKNLYLFPTCSTAFYRHGPGGWKKIYSRELSEKQKKKVLEAFEKALKETGFKPEKTFGEIIEDRGSQITFSALGQLAPLEVKKEWDPGSRKRLEIKLHLEKYIPEFEIRVGGTTSIDVTKKGIDKGYGIRQIEKILGFSKAEILFIGDALFEGGNDYPVKTEGIECIGVASPDDTKSVIRRLIKG